MFPADDELRLRTAFDDLTSDQPPAPPNRYEAIRRKTAARRRHQIMTKVAAGLGTAGLAVTGATVSSLVSAGHRPVTIRGILAVSRPSASLRASCPPPLVGA